MTDLLYHLKSSENNGSQNLFQHLCDLIQTLTEKDAKLTNFNQLELISEFVKQNAFQYNSNNEIAKPLNQNQQFIDQFKKFEQLLKKQKILNKFHSQNFYTESKIYEQVNISFGEDESYRIQQSLLRLAEKENASQIKFWGKIYGTKNDYFVAQGMINTQNRDKGPEGSENPGFGCNKYTFWVCNNVTDNWVELPLITPKQIQVARQLKVLFSGDLNKEIKTYPSFPGKEKHLLKAQIVRITHSAQIVPRGIYKLNEENPKEIDFDEEGKIPEQSELMSLENWTHFNPNILVAGRITHYVNPSLTEEEKEAQLTALLEQDSEIERLKAIIEDKPLEGSESNYSIKFFGNPQLYAAQNEGSQISYQIIMIKNHLWPGMITIAKQGFYSNLYIGNGFKTGTSSFYPLQPALIQLDPEDFGEVSEPNPSKAPIIEVKVEEGQQDDQKQEEDQEVNPEQAEVEE